MGTRFRRGEDCQDAPVPSREAPVLVAPRSFGGDLRAWAVAAAVGRGLEGAGLRVPDCCPVADGGEGTLEVLVPALGGELVPVAAHGAGSGPRPGQLALLEDGETALVEAARGSARGPAGATTRAAGECICAAADRGAGVILVAAGGEVAADFGAGALQAIAERGGIGRARLVVLCDAPTPWEALGSGAADAARALPRDPRGRPRTGAGAGLAGALWAAHGAVLEPGAAWILDVLDFNARMRAAHAVVTGDARLDARTLEGAVAGEICVRARQAGVPAHAVTGRNALDAFDQRILDLQLILQADTLGGLEAAGETLGAALREGAA